MSAAWTGDDGEKANHRAGMAWMTVALVTAAGMWRWVVYVRVKAHSFGRRLQGRHDVDDHGIDCQKDSCWELCGRCIAAG